MSHAYVNEHVSLAEGQKPVTVLSLTRASEHTELKPTEAKEEIVRAITVAGSLISTLGSE